MVYVYITDCFVHSDSISGLISGVFEDVSGSADNRARLTRLRCKSYDYVLSHTTTL